MSPKSTKLLDFACKGPFFMLACSMIVTPICLVEMGEALGINLTQRGGLESARSIPLFLIILASGFLVRKVSSTKLLTAGLGFISVGLSVVGLSRSYATTLGAMVLMGAGSGFIEGLVNPLIAKLHPENPEHHLNVTHAVFSIGVFCCVLLFGELLTFGVPWRFLYIASAAGTLAVGILFGFAGSTIETDAGKIQGSYLEPLSIPLFWIVALAMFLSAGTEAGFTFWTASFIQDYHAAMPRLSGIGTAIFAGSMAAGRMLVGRLSSRFSVRNILLVASCSGIVVSVLVIYAGSMVSVFFLLAAAGLIVSGFWPSLLAIASRKIPCETTTLFILVVSSGIGGFGAAPYIIGALGDRWGLRGGLFLVPLLFLGTAVLLLSIKDKKIT
jgi:fucose permease